jgi:hypothetical protein
VRPEALPMANMKITDFGRGFYYEDGSISFLLMLPIY